VSGRPDGGFVYGGVVISNCDLFPGKEGKPLACFGNNHGGLEFINGKYYIFYHRETNRSICSRQGCAEEVTILPDGSIPQVEMTSCGLNKGPLRAEGTYSAGIACNLYGKETPTYSHPLAMMGRHPYITQDGPDWTPGMGGQPPRSYIANGKDGLVAGFKYFDLGGARRITVRVRGTANGTLFVRTDPNGENLAEIGLCPSKDWKPYTSTLLPCTGTHPLYLCYKGKGKIDILDFSF
jgi:hypothetical protein